MAMDLKAEGTAVIKLDRSPRKYRKRDKCMIIGSGPSMSDAPLKGDDIDTFDVWVLNAFHRQFDDPTLPSLWFQLHRPGSGEGHIDDPDHVQFLKTYAGCPVLMVDEYDWIPAAELYPLEELSYLQLPTHKRPYFTNTVDFMVALAIHERYPDIYLYGVDMISDDDHEFAVNRASVSWYLGIAHGYGVRLHLPDSSALLRAPRVYGFEERPKENLRLIALLKREIEEYKRMRADEERTQREHLANYNALCGMIRQAEKDIKILELRDRGSQF